MLFQLGLLCFECQWWKTTLLPFFDFFSAKNQNHKSVKVVFWEPPQKWPKTSCPLSSSSPLSQFTLPFLFIINFSFTMYLFSSIVLSLFLPAICKKTTRINVVELVLCCIVVVIVIVWRKWRKIHLNHKEKLKPSHLGNAVKLSRDLMENVGQ